MFELIPDSDPRLHQVCDPVAEDEIGGLRDTIAAMFPFMYENRGVGLAAPQIGITKRFFVLGRGGVELACINPEIVQEQQDPINGIEGCLSYPGLRLPVKRPEIIKVRYTTPEGRTKTHRLKGIMARAYLHEYDHLDGIVFGDRTELPKRDWDIKPRLYVLDDFD